MTQRIHLATILPLLWIISLLTACGFQLRGTMDLNSDLTRIAIAGHDAQYVRQLTKALNNNGITVAETAEYRLRIVKLEKKTGQQTQSSAGRYERELTLTATYQLETNDQLTLFSPIKLSNFRFISYNQNQTNSAQSEENIAYKELTQELIYTTVRRIAGISGTQLETERLRARKIQQLEQEQNAEALQ